MEYALSIKKRSIDFLMRKGALDFAVASFLAAAPIVASADNLYKCMGEEGQIYYQDIKCTQAREAMFYLSANARTTGPSKINPSNDGEAMLLSSPKNALELSGNPVKNNQAQPKS